jgi:arylsulfatase A-like enzyme
VTRPNILLVLTDQHRAGLSAREGYPLDTTPYLDELAARGAWFDGAYTAAPVCAPARTSLITGRFPSAHRVTQNAAWLDAVRAGDLFGSLRAEGYATAIVGKNHTYLSEDDVDVIVEFGHGGQESGRRSPAEAQFDDWLFGLAHHTAAERTTGGVELQNPFRIVSHSIDWIDSVPEDRPFLLQVSFPEPHNPYQVCPPYYDLFPPDAIPDPVVGEEFLETADFPWRYLRRIGELGEPGYREKVPRARSNYLGMIRLIDDQLRRLGEHLESAGRAADTIVIVTADHGDYFGDYGLVRKGAGVPESLMRVPLIVSGAGIRPRRAPRPELVSLVDVLPTVCELAGATIPDGVQGASFASALRAEATAPGFESVYAEQGIGGVPLREEQLPEPLPGMPPGHIRGWPCFDELNAVTQGGRLRMVREGAWKLIANEGGRVRLYDLATDPAELDDLSASPAHRDPLERMLRVLARWIIRVEDELPLPEHGYLRGAPLSRSDGPVA